MAAKRKRKTVKRRSRPPRTISVRAAYAVLGLEPVPPRQFERVRILDATLRSYRREKKR